MLSIEEIKLMPEINEKIVTAGICQAEIRLNDSIDNKRALDLKSIALLCLYKLCLIMCFVSVSPHPTAGAAFMIGCVLLFASLLPADYGTLGRYPDTWLRKDVLDGDKKAYSLTMAYVLHDYQDKIRQSDKSNEKKASLFRYAVYCGFIAILLFVSSMFF